MTAKTALGAALIYNHTPFYTKPLSATTANGIKVHNFYVPAGGDVPDRDENPKFGHKLDFIAEMTAYFSQNRPQRS